MKAKCPRVRYTRVSATASARYAIFATVPSGWAGASLGGSVFPNRNREFTAGGPPPLTPVWPGPLFPFCILIGCCSRGQTLGWRHGPCSRGWQGYYYSVRRRNTKKTSKRRQRNDISKVVCLRRKVHRPHGPPIALSSGGPLQHRRCHAEGTCSAGLSLVTGFSLVRTLG